MGTYTHVAIGTDRQTDRQTDIHTQICAPTHVLASMHRQMDTQTRICTGVLAHTHTDRHTERERGGGGVAGKQAGRQTETDLVGRSRRCSTVGGPSPVASPLTPLSAVAVSPGQLPCHVGCVHMGHVVRDAMPLLHPSYILQACG